MIKYSSGMAHVFERAQAYANRFETTYLETWQVLLGMIDHSGTIAHLVFNDFEDKIPYDRYIRVASKMVEKEYQADKEISELKPQSRALEDLLAYANGIADAVQSEEVGTEHVLFAILLSPEIMANRLLELAGFNHKEKGHSQSIAGLRRSVERYAGMTKENLKAIREIKNPRKNKMMMSDLMKPQQQTGELSDYTRDLTEMALDGRLEPVVGREEEITRMVQILSRKTKNNPVLVGDAGVGKTALAYGLAQRIVDGEVPIELADSRLLELDLMSVIAGTRFRGDFEERMNQIISEIEADGHIILFIDELHTIMGSGSGIDSTLDAANILKPALARGTLRTVGATTQEEYQKHIEKDAALSRRFAKVQIDEPSVEEGIKILMGLRPSYEAYHHVEITDQAVEAAVKYAHRYLTSKNLPDSAIDLLDEASATAQNMVKKEREKELSPADEAILAGNFKKLQTLLNQMAAPKEEKKIVVSEDNILKTLSQLSGIPVMKLTQTDAKKYLNLEQELHKRVIGQDQAISAISRAIRRNQSGIRTGHRPIGSFMFLGPTGVGKTELAKALAEALFDDESALIRFDMSEYMEKFAASRLNGAPPGYVGYEEGGELTEKVRNKPYSVLLFDEVEKAHPDIFNVLLQVLDDGVLTDSRGRRVDFSNTIIIMTSNLGATALRDDKTVGFGARDLSQDYDAMQKRIMEELKHAYRPEFINRIDEKVVFHSLTADHMKEVVKIMVKPLIAALANKGVTLKFQPSALKLLASEGYDIEMGARPLRRTLQTEVEDKLAELILAGDLTEGTTLKVGVHKGQLKFDQVN